MQGSNEDWKYVMEPSDTCCLSLTSKGCPCPRGKGLGGSSLLNGLMYLRGNRKDYDDWAEAGNPGWDHDSLVQHFKNFERAPDGNPDYGHHGEVNIVQAPSEEKIIRVIKEGFEELGFKKRTEGNPLGYFDSYFNMKDGHRENMGKTFIGTIKERKNLYVATKAHVVKLLIEKKIAKGLEVKIGQTMIKLKATKEVILSAGAINSPQILMQSGIGPKDHLTKLGIKVKKDLQVGKNLQDHLFFPGFYFKFAPSMIAQKTSTDLMDDVYQYFMYRKGRLSHTAPASFMAMVDPKNTSLYPSIQYMSVYVNQDEKHMLDILHRTLKPPQEIIDFQLAENERSSTMIFFPTLLKPKSVGSIELRSTDPFDPPKIFPNYLSDAKNEDLEVMLQGVRFLQKLLSTKALKEAKTEVLRLDIPNCRNFGEDSDDYWRCAIRNIATNVYHPVGTCKMGPERDGEAVVDPRLRVHGIGRLRVVDASIMPTITSGNTNSPAIMIGEKGAALVEEDWANVHEEL